MKYGTAPLIVSSDGTCSPVVLLRFVPKIACLTTRGRQTDIAIKFDVFLNQIVEGSFIKG